MCGIVKEIYGRGTLIFVAGRHRYVVQALCRRSKQLKIQSILRLRVEVSGTIFEIADTLGISNNERGIIYVKL